jgi:hypothetical protein
LMCTTARLTLRRVLRFLALATVPLLLINQAHSHVIGFLTSIDSKADASPGE